MNYTPMLFESTKQRQDCLEKVYMPILGSDVVSELIVRGFCTAPASTKYHGAYAGGLFDHSVNVANCLAALTKENGLEWDGRDMSPYIVGILHDLCKIDQYKWNEEQGKYEYNKDLLVKGHGIKSVIYCYEMIDFPLTPEESACIQYHMGAFTPQEEWEDYNRAIRTYNNVLWTHTADMIVSQIMGV